MREAEAAVSRYSNPDVLPAHPPPIRPGLLQDATPPPAPVRQYNPDRTSTPSIQTAVEAPITAPELEALKNSAKLNPSDQKLQLTLAKKMVEAATVLASEGGRADIKTTRKNRENYIFDAHKIIKKLANSVRGDIYDYRFNQVHGF
jgi:hypothetical protein